MLVNLELCTEIPKSCSRFSAAFAPCTPRLWLELKRNKVAPAKWWKLKRNMFDAPSACCLWPIASQQIIISPLPPPRPPLTHIHTCFRSKTITESYNLSQPDEVEPFARVKGEIMVEIEEEMLGERSSLACRCCFCPGSGRDHLRIIQYESP